jgi:hypothetical protein
MFMLTLKIDQDLVAEYECKSEAEGSTIANRLVQLSRVTWSYDDETKTWSWEDRTMTISEV